MIVLYLAGCKYENKETATTNILKMENPVEAEYITDVSSDYAVNVTEELITGFWSFAGDYGQGFYFKDNHDFIDSESEGGTGTWSCDAEKQMIYIYMNYDMQTDESGPVHSEYTMTMEILEISDNEMKVNLTDGLGKTDVYTFEKNEEINY
jgi:hypothetical protein